MSILTEDVDGPINPACGDRNKYIITVVTKAKNTTKKSAKGDAVDEMESKRTALHDNVKATKHCPHQKCKDNEEWEGLDTKQDVILLLQTKKKPREWTCIYYGTATNVLACLPACPPPKKEKKKKRR